MTNVMKDWKQIGAVVSTIIAILVIGHGNTRGQSVNETRKREAETRDESAPQSKTPGAESASWTCPMHPQVKQPKKGKCPICAMELLRDPIEPSSSDGKVIQNQPTLISLEEMLSIALQSNPDVRASQAKSQAAEAELDRTRLEVVQKIIAFREKWQTRRAEVIGAETELQQFEQMRALVKQGVLAGKRMEGEESARQKVLLLRAKLAEIEAELPFLLGSHPKRRRRPNDEFKQKARAQLEAARQAMQAIGELQKHREPVTSEQIYCWSHRLMQAELEVSGNDADRTAAIEKHLERMKTLEKRAEEGHRNEEISYFDLLEARWHRLEAEAMSESKTK
ncbi:MAG: heavy metal-binding domain-containing protein [Pirellulales bacterium]